MEDNQELLQSQEISRLLLREISSCVLSKARTEQRVKKQLQEGTAVLQNEREAGKSIVIGLSKVSTLADELLLPTEVVQRSFEVSAALQHVSLEFTDQ
jgi:hypothetical protein